MERNVFNILDLQTVPDKFFPYTEEIKSLKVPIVIDNGSHQCKAGWAINEKPSLIFRNLVAKNRSKKDHEIQVGNEISNIEQIRWLLKTQFDRNIVTQFDVQELIYDHIFNHLGIDTANCVDHPIVLTEAICNPSHSRQLMSELMFECYQVPKLVYGVDAMYSFLYNTSTNPAKHGIIVCSGYNTTHVIPVLNGQMDLPQCRRINIGGSHMMAFLNRLLQLKYPAHFPSINLSRCELLIQEHMKVATYFQEELEKWNDDDYYDEHVHKIQLPYTPLPGQFKSANGGKMERCYAMLKRLQESNAEKRAEAIVSDEERLQHLLSLQELLEDDEDDALLQRSLHELGINSADELQLAINRVNQRIQKTRNYLPYFCLDGNDLQEPQQKRICSELQLHKFSDPDSWIKVVKQKCEELRRSKHKLEQCSQARQKVSNTKHSPKKFELLTGLKQCETETMEESEAAKEEEKLRELEAIVREYDREFNKKQSTGLKPNYSFNLADYYQLHLGIERIRIPEILFQPSIIGVDQAGISETIEMVLACYSPEVQLNLVQNVFLTGGCTLIPGFKKRMEADLLSMRPFQTTFCVQVAENPILDPWHGAKQWVCENNNLQLFGTTKAEYEEKGNDYFKQHNASNWYFSNVI